MNAFRQVLTQYLVRVGQLELIGQRIRQSILQNSYFQIQTVFQRFDKFHKGYLIPADFSQFALQNKIYPTQSQLYVMFRDFDVMRLGHISLEDFTLQIAPRQNQKVKQEALSRKYYPAKQRLEVDLQFLISKYFEHKIHQFNELQVIRHQLHQIFLSYPQEAFALIDKSRKAQIQNLNQIDHFLRLNAKVLKQQQLVRIFRVLSFGKKKIDFPTFLEHISPLGQGYYINYEQRVRQKQKIHHSYLQKKINIEHQILQNSRRKIRAIGDLEELRNSNRRLQNLLQQQKLDFQRQSIVRRFQQPYFY